jgi:hypothetical protein
VAADQRAHRFDPDVGGEYVERDRDQLLRSALRVRRAQPGTGEQPEDDQAGDRLDQRVGAETDQRDRAGGEAGANGDRCLQHVVADSTPR